MADRRRRRLSEGETETDEEDDKPSKKGVETSEDGDVTGDSDEYESVTEDQDDDDDDDEEDEETETESEGDEVLFDGEGDWVDEERQSGDGEEQPDQAALDDDEDKKNPAYIPRKGAFYEHDSRSEEQDENKSNTEKQETQSSNKKLWKDEHKWDHDKFFNDQQAPKSRQEIIAIYGYDIRAYDKPPDAPPPRREKERLPPKERRNRFGDFIENQDAYSDERQYRQEYRQRYPKDQGYRGGRGRGLSAGRGNHRRPQDEGRFHDNHHSDHANESERSYDNRQYHNDRNGRQYEEKRGQGSRGRGRGRGRGGFSSNRSERYNDDQRQSWIEESHQRQGNTRLHRFSHDNNSHRNRTGEDGRTDVISGDALESRQHESTERKAYSKDRRNKNADNSRTQDYKMVESTDPEMVVAAQGQDYTITKDDESSVSKQQEIHAAADRTSQLPSGHKQDSQQPRPKRYSSQRQRNIAEASYPDSGASTPPSAGAAQAQFYASPPGYPQHQAVFSDASSQNQQIIRQPVRYHVPPGAAVSQMSSPPRVYTVTSPAAMGQSQSMMPAGFIPSPNILSFPPPVVPHYQMPAGVAIGPRVAPFASPPPQSANQAQVIQQVTPQVMVPQPIAPLQPPVSSGVEGMHIGGTMYFKTDSATMNPTPPSGTTYYNPESQAAPNAVRPKKASGITYYSPDQQQQPVPSRSPVRRTKTAIPIVKPKQGEPTQLLNEADPPSLNENTEEEESMYTVIESSDAPYEQDSNIKHERTDDSKQEAGLPPDPSSNSQTSVLVAKIKHEPTPLELVYTQPKVDYTESNRVKHIVTASGDHPDLTVETDVSGDKPDMTFETDVSGDLDTTVAAGDD